MRLTNNYLVHTQVMESVLCATPTYALAPWSGSVTSVTMAPIKVVAPSVEAREFPMLITARSAPSVRKM